MSGDSSSGAGEQPSTDLAAVTEVVRRDVEGLGVCSPACRRALEQLTALAPTQPEVVQLERLGHQVAQDWDGLVRVERRMASVDSSPLQRLRLSGALRQLGDLEAAEQELRSALEATDDAALRIQHGVVLFELDRPVDALAAFDGLDGLAPLDDGPQAQVSTLRGLIALYDDDLTRAEAELRRAVELQPTSLSALNGLARVLAASGRAADARTLLQQVTELRARKKERDAYAIRRSARSFQMAEACGAGDLETCAAVVEAALPELQPADQARFLSYQAQSLVRAGRADEARAVQQRAAAIVREAGQ